VGTAVWLENLHFFKWSLLIGGGLCAAVGCVGIVACLVKKFNAADGVACVLCLALGLAFVASEIPSGARISTARGFATHQIKTIALAMQNYADHFGHYPPDAIRDADGKPLLSWRVRLLPFVEYDTLYREFNLNEPWDGPHNRTLLDKMPRVYQSGYGSGDTGMTFYRVFVGPGTAFERPGLTPSDFPNGLENTVFVIEAGEAVPWTKPDELEYAPDKPLPPLGGVFTCEGNRWERMHGFRSGYFGGFGDGSVRFFPRDTSESTLRPLITRNGR
jgi:hypothetical protein